MSYLSQVKKAVPQAPAITIVGFPGAGKTTLAAGFPNPIFIQAESASTVFETWDVDKQPAFLPELPSPDAKKNLRTSDVILAQLRELASAEHPYQTVVIDTITSLNQLLEREVVEFDGDANVQDVANAAGGFHKGYGVLAGLHAKIMKACIYLAKKKGIAVILLSHTGFEKIKSRPDQPSEYTVFTPDLHRDSKKIYVSNSDAVLYLKARELVMGHESNRKGQTTKYGRITNTGERVLITSSDGSVGYVDAKNRYNLPPEIDIQKGDNPLLGMIPFYNGGVLPPVQAHEEIDDHLTETEEMENQA